MPAFDPVRDAINNSPLNHTYALPPTPTFHASTTASSTPTAAAAAPSTSSIPRRVASPTFPKPPIRRGSSIAMLLNDAPQPDASTSYPSPLPPPPHQAQAQPRSLLSTALYHEPESFLHEPQTPVSPAGDSRSFPFPLHSSSSSRTLSNLPQTRSPPKPHFPSLPPRRTSHSPTLSPTTSVRSRPSSSHSYTMPPPPPPPRLPSALPYNPIRRTPPQSVLNPLTPAEAERFRHPDNILRRTLRHRDRPNRSHAEHFSPTDSRWPLTPSRTPPGDADSSGDSGRRKKRLRSETEDDLRHLQPPSKRTRDQLLVASHYNTRPEVGVVARRESPIIGLKNFNNWIKSVLIIKFAHTVLASSEPAPINPNGRPPRNRLAGRVLDLGCGKGGDLLKWSRAKVREYVGLDIAEVSVNQARQRWQQMRTDRYEAYFSPLDCYTDHISTAVPGPILSTPFDVVSMQFCMHYAFESVSKTRVMLNNVSNYLRPGGVFIGTIPNAEQLMEQLNSIPADSTDLSFGNDVYRIRFDNRDAPLYGQRYHFFLKDAVDDVPEYVVHWDHFENLAREHGLHLLYKREFHEVFQDEQENPEFKSLLQKMKVVDASGVSHMTEEQWVAANIYIAFAFEKR